MNLITRFPFLHQTRSTRLKLINHFKKEDYTRNSLLFKQGDEFTHIYLILFGEFSQRWTNGNHNKPVAPFQHKGQSDLGIKKNYLVNKNGNQSDEQEIAILSSFQACGLEEWLSGSTTYLTTVKCMSASGEVKNPTMIELFENLYGMSQSGQGSRKKKLIIQNAKILKIKKDIFIKIVNGRSNKQLVEYAQNKIKFN